MAKKAKFKFNSGYGALCCSHCGRTIKEGVHFTEEEWQACRGEIKLKPQFCDVCNERKEQLGKN
jgi:hypothetical protein